MQTIEDVRRHIEIFDNFKFYKMIWKRKKKVVDTINYDYIREYLGK